ncbi:MAG TPA: AIM24 family protein [Thermoanaerobaculia bacterium]|nr:AIM24 family protein [Thermoanaerobaculia bacterium]
MTNPDPAGRSYTCPWCGLASDGTTLSCPACGAAVDVKAVTTRSGWTELPGRHDMAKIQFGQSTCQIEGTYVPVADMNLAANDWVYFSHHVLLWMDTAVKVSAMSLKGAWKRMLAGMPLIMTQAVGPGRIAFSRDAPGEMIALPLQPGQAVDVREHLFMVATGGVTYDWFNSNIWFSTQEGDETETHYPMGMLLDRFHTPTYPGLLLLHAAGNVFVRNLREGETILIKPTAFLFKDPTVQMQLHIERPAGTWRSWRSWGDRYLWVRLWGPGRVAVQSAFEHLEDNGRNIVNHSGATQHQW